MAPSTSDPDESLPLLARAEAMVNITLDDTSPFITYSDGWGVQSQQDPDLDFYSQDTYHGTEAVGANATILFSGSGVFLFGSMGPDHGNFEVSVNGARQTFSGYSTTPLFQQCLFSSMLDENYNEIILINIGGSDGNYMDLDYIVTTVPENTTFPAQTPLPAITPSDGFPTASASLSSSSAQGSSSSSSSSSTSATVTTALTAVFALLSVVLLIVLAVLYLRYRRRRRAEQEHFFRYGNGANGGTSPAPAAQPEPMTDSHWATRTQTHGSVGLDSQGFPYPPRHSPAGSSLMGERGSHQVAGKGKRKKEVTFLPGFDA